jgi:hypothetical protein
MIYGNDSGLAPASTALTVPFGPGRLSSPLQQTGNRLVSGWNAADSPIGRQVVLLAFLQRADRHDSSSGKNGILRDRAGGAVVRYVSVNRADLGQPATRRDIQSGPRSLAFPEQHPRLHDRSGFYNIDSSFFKITPITERE